MLVYLAPTKLTVPYSGSALQIPHKNKLLFIVSSEYIIESYYPVLCIGQLQLYLTGFRIIH